MRRVLCLLPVGIGDAVSIGDAQSLWLKKPKEDTVTIKNISPIIWLISSLLIWYVLVIFLHFEQTTSVGLAIMSLMYGLYTDLIRYLESRR